MSHGTGMAEFWDGIAPCRGSPARIPSCTGLHAAENRVSYIDNNIGRNSIPRRGFHSRWGEIHR